MPIKKFLAINIKIIGQETREIFIIDKIFYTTPVTYSIKAEDGEEIFGKFYSQELLKTEF